MAHGKKIEETGWGVIFAQDADPALSEALAPLLELRRRQAGDRFRIFSGSAGLRPQESATQFQERHRGELPHYLLLVGGREAIPYGFETQLAARFAVGRIAFDRIEDYASYASSVVEADSDSPDAVLLGEKSGGCDPPNFGDGFLGGRGEEGLDRGLHDDEGRRGETEGYQSGWVDPRKPAAEPDNLKFSAYHPRVLEAGVAQRILVYAHLPAALAEIENDAAGRLGRAFKKFKKNEAERQARILEGTTLLLVPEAKGVVFDPPESELVWKPPFQAAELTATADGSRTTEVTHASIAVYVGPLMVAEIELDLLLLPQGHASLRDETHQSSSSTAYESIFASYSHDDTALVEAMEEVFTATGMEYLRDAKKLRSGQPWSSELLKMIEKADIFQLFWSATASRSTYVEMEWRHAWHQREKKGGGFIRPLYWEDPMPQPPEPLSKLQFARLRRIALEPPARP
jgi:hypothetical protein